MDYSGLKTEKKKRSVKAILSAGVDSQVVVFYLLVFTEIL